MTARAEAGPLRWGFSTLGCAELSLEEVCALSARFDFPEVEVRGLNGRLDVAECAHEEGWNSSRARTLLTKHGARLPVVGSGFKLVGGASAGDFDELFRTAELAETWGAPYVRVFGGGTWGVPLKESDFDEAAANIRQWRREKKARGWKVEMLLETHDAFSASPPCAHLQQKLEKPIGIIWDAHHTWRLGGEPPAHSWRMLSPNIRHVHIKDSIDSPSARHGYTYVLPGKGQTPLEEIISVLRENGFNGAVSLEWERFWHPYLPPLQQALDHLRSQPWFAANGHEQVGSR